MSGRRSGTRYLVRGGIAATLVLMACACDGGGSEAETTSNPQVAATATLNPNHDTTLDATPVDSSVATAGERPHESLPAPVECQRRPLDVVREITIWHSLRTDAARKFDELVDRYNQLDTGVSVIAVSQGGYSEVVAALAAAPAEDRPDLLLIDQRGVQALHDSELFLQPNECEGGDDLLDGLVPVIAAAYAIDGEPAAIPYNVSTPLLMFNATTVRAAGLDPADPPDTLDELSAAAVQVQAEGAAKFGLVAHDGLGPWFVMQYNSRTGELTGTPDNGRGAELMGRVAFTNPATMDAFEWLEREVGSGRAAWVGSNVSGADDLIRLVDAEQGAAFAMSTSASTGDILHLLESGSFPGAELGVAPLPGPGGSGGLVGGGGLWLTQRDDPVQAGTAFEFVEWLMAPAQHAEFSAYTGYVPVSAAELDEPVLIEAWAKYPQLRVGFDVLSPLDPSALWAGPAFGPGDEIHNLLYTAVSNIIEGGEIVGELEAAAAEADDLLGVYAEIQPGE